MALLLALDEAQAAILDLQSKARERCASGETASAAVADDERRAMHAAMAKLEAAERAIQAAETAQRSDAAEADRAADRLGNVAAPAPAVIDVAGGPVGLDLPCGGQLGGLQHEDRTRLAFMLASAVEELQRERAAREKLQAALHDAAAALEGESYGSGELRRENAALRARLVQQMSANIELQGELRRVEHAREQEHRHGGADGREAFDSMLERCDEIADRFEQLGGADAAPKRR